MGSSPQFEKTTKGLGGKNKLIGKLIDKLSIYYGLAIYRNHSSIEKMKNKIWMTCTISFRIGDKPQHEKCPSDENS